MKQLLKMIEEKDEDIEWGTLTLQIYCSKCETSFELNSTGIAMHMATNSSIWDYIKWIQLSKCTKCNESMDKQIEQSQMRSTGRRI